MTERRALVVEVDTATQLGLLSFLRVRGYECVAASSAGEAMETLAEGTFSFTLVNLGSNGTHPAELIRRLKLHGRKSGPIIAVADRGDDGLHPVPLEVDTVLHKPLSLDDLQAVLDALVRPQPSTPAPSPDQIASRIRREMELCCSPKMLEAAQILREAARVDVTAVLAATNQDLERAVAEGRFREDLYYRLNVIHVFVPPLRERAIEIPLLANYFVERYAKLYRRDGFTIPPPVMERLTRHRYPGNVRELENLVKRMIVLDDPFLTRVPLPDAGADSAPLPSPPAPAPEPSLKDIARRASQAAEREAISKMLERTGWNRVRAARALRISYRALLYKIKQTGLDGERSSARSAS